MTRFDLASPRRLRLDTRLGRSTCLIALALLLTLPACREDDVWESLDSGPEAGVDARPGPDTAPPKDVGAKDSSGSDASVTPGDPNILLLRGTVVSPDTVLDPGEVLLEGDKILCVAASCAGESKAAGATTIETAGLIFPGLIDAHNHTQYNYLPVWTPPKLYKNHNQWQASSAYDTFIDPHRTLDNTLMCEMVKYGEIRSLLAGTTMIQGTPLRKCADTLIRNADLPYHGTGPDIVRTNVLGIGQVDAAGAQQLKDEFTSGKIKAYIIHLSEGIDETARKEFDQLEAHGLLLPQVVVIHGTALGETELKKIAAAKMPMIWSPTSNLALYGQTNDIKLAKSLGIQLSLSPDWTPSGAPNILEELRGAQQYNKDKLASLFTAKELVQMVTINPAKAMGFGDDLGSLEVGKRADVTVIAGDKSKPYEALIGARLNDVRLVIVEGKALYGDANLLKDLAPNTFCEDITVCQAAKTVCVKESESDTNKLNQTLTDVESALSGGYPGILELATGCQ
jgi:5-methylthioadenosine/S-adenosylhomocysteine deaminase